ncbi:hypothetical protein [Megalodesulfovibrio paquesii]
MPPKPIDQRHPLAGNDAVWTAMLELADAGRDITVAAVGAKVLRGKGEIREYLRRLCLAGVCTATPGQGIGAMTTYRLTQRPAQAPHLDKEGKPFPETDQQRMWRGLRMMKACTAVDLATAVSVKESVAYTYLKMLAHAGYVTRSGDQYRLVRQHGPLAPMIQKVKQVYDPNLQAVVWPQGAQKGARP